LSHLQASDLAERFDAEHRRVYLHGGEAGRRVEIVGLRFGVRRRLDQLPTFRERIVQLDRPAGVSVRVGAADLPTRLVDAAALRPNDPVAGPALIEGYSSATWVPPRWGATRDDAGNIIMRRTAA
jgi:N-methylhydantoinase A